VVEEVQVEAELGELEAELVGEVEPIEVELEAEAELVGEVEPVEVDLEAEAELAGEVGQKVEAGRTLHRPTQK